MYAIVEIAGQQFKVETGRTVYVHLLNADEGSKVTFDKVLLTENEGKVSVGKPTLATKVEATVLEHLKGDKVIIFKKKRRKGYQLEKGHRQSFSKIMIDSIA